MPADVASVGGALSLALAGDSVLVAPGHWACAATLPSGVVLAGTGADGSVTLDAGGAGVNVVANGHSR